MSNTKSNVYLILHSTRLKAAQAAPAFLVLVTTRHLSTSTSYYFIPPQPPEIAAYQSYPRQMASYQFISKRV